MARKLNGKAVREIRQLVGLSQRQLADRTGFVQGTICHLEKGDYVASPMVMRKLADALGVSLDSITFPVPEPEPAPEPTVAA